MKVHIPKLMVMAHMEGDNTTLLKPYKWLVLKFNKFINNYILGEESALVVSWWDIVVMSIFTWLVFMFLGPVVDDVYGYINSSQNNTFAANFYTASDIKTAGDLYNVYQWVPYLAIGVIIFYALNYSNMKKGGE